MSFLSAQAHIVPASEDWAKWLGRISHDIYHSRREHVPSRIQQQGKLSFCFYNSIST